VNTGVPFVCFVGWEGLAPILHGKSR